MAKMNMTTTSATPAIPAETNSLISVSDCPAISAATSGTPASATTGETFCVSNNARMTSMVT